MEINGNKVSELSNEEIDELIDDYNLGDYEEYLTDEEKKKKFNFKFLNSENKIVDYGIKIYLIRAKHIEVLNSLALMCN